MIGALPGKQREAFLTALVSIVETLQNVGPGQAAEPARCIGLVATHLIAMASTKAGTVVRSAA